MASLKRLRDMIRAQAGVRGHDTMVGVIDDIINEVLTEYTARAKCPELLVTNAVFTSDGDGTPTFAGPNDIQHFLTDRVYFGDASEGPQNARRLYESALHTSPVEGLPIKYQRVGYLIRVMPYTDIVAITHQIWIDYYKTPTQLINDTDQFPVPSLEQTVKLEAIARVARYANSALSKDFQGDATKAFSASRAQEGR